jgi:N-dimethylarginine dimethylaminohydrolase
MEARGFLLRAMPVAVVCRKAKRVDQTVTAHLSKLTTSGSAESRIPLEQAIVVGEEDANEFARNAVNIGDKIILNGASCALRGALARAGFEVERTPLSEFLRAGGASKCLTLRLEEAL